MINHPYETLMLTHLAVLGKTGSGKTYATKSLVESLLEKQRHVCIIDPTGAWWGLRSSADGKRPGFQILVLGGDHGDLPLGARSGAAVAKMVAEQRVSAVIDVSLFTVGERTRWFIDFATTLFRLNRDFMHLVVDEMHMFAPQGKVPDVDTGKMLHAANTLASGGRSRGIQLTMITQRPAKLHKDALTCADAIIAMRMVAPQDREAVEAWVLGCGDSAQGKKVLNSLASLARGEGWVWHPERSILNRTTFPKIKTFDSSATPTHGTSVAAPKSIAEIDLTEVRQALEDSIKEIEASDPKMLLARIRELESQKPRTNVMSVNEANELANRSRAEGFKEGFQAALDVARTNVNDAIRKIELPSDQKAVFSKPVSHQPVSPVPTAVSKNFPSSTKSEVKLGAEMRILGVLAGHSPTGLTMEQWALLSCMKKSSGTWSTYVSRLRSRSYIEKTGDVFFATKEGLDAIGGQPPRMTREEIIMTWKSALGSGPARIIDCLREGHRTGRTAEEIAEALGMSKSSGTFSTYMSRARSSGLVKKHGDCFMIAEDLRN